MLRLGMNTRDRTSKHNKLVRLRTGDADDFDVSTLMAWSRDKDQEVRDWATFVLGSQTDFDSEDVRQALRDRLNDADFETRCEALVGLARRRDEAAIQPLFQAFEGEFVSMLMIEAAGYFGRAEFVPILTGLRSWWDVDTELLEKAIAHCSGEHCDWWWHSDGRVGTTPSS